MFNASSKPQSSPQPRLWGSSQGSGNHNLPHRITPVGTDPVRDHLQACRLCPQDSQTGHRGANSLGVLELDKTQISPRPPFGEKLKAKLRPEQQPSIKQLIVGKE